MKELTVLLYRDWLEFKRKYISYMLLWFSLPMIFYLFLTIPLSEAFDEARPETMMRYKSWSLPGIWVCSSCLLSYLYSFIKLKNLISREEQLEKYLKAPLSNGQFLWGLFISSIIFGIIQLSISMFVTINLNIGEVIDNIDLLMISFNILTIIILFSILGLLSAFYVQDDFFSFLLIFIIFIFSSFTLGTLVPIEMFPEKLSDLIGNLPIHKVVLNTQLDGENLTKRESD